MNPGPPVQLASVDSQIRALVAGQIAAALVTAGVTAPSDAQIDNALAIAEQAMARMAVKVGTETP